MITLMTAGAVASLRVLIEAWLRKRLALHGIKNVQAVCTLTGMLLMFATFGFVLRGTEPTLLLAAADAVGGVLLFGPAASAIGVVLHPAYALLFVAWVAAVMMLCLRSAAKLVSTGLISEGGPYQGTRTAGSNMAS